VVIGHVRPVPVLSDTPIAAAINGCVILLSRSKTIWTLTLLRGYFPSQRCFQPSDLALGAFYHLFPPNQMI
jgi:hypothetical protein